MGPRLAAWVGKPLSPRAVVSVTPRRPAAALRSAQHFLFAAEAGVMSHPTGGGERTTSQWRLTKRNAGSPLRAEPLASGPLPPWNRFTPLRGPLWGLSHLQGASAAPAPTCATEPHKLSLTPQRLSHVCAGPALGLVRSYCRLKILNMFLKGAPLFDLAPQVLGPILAPCVTKD